MLPLERLSRVEAKLERLEACCEVTPAKVGSSPLQRVTGSAVELGGRGLQLVAIDSFDVPFASQHVVPPLVLDPPSGIRRGGSPGDWASKQRQSLSERFGS